jgi:hypothetical protein
MRQFTVSVGHGRAAALHRKALASLPDHFRIVESGSIDAVLLADETASKIEGARLIVLGDLAAIKASFGAATAVVPAFRYVPRLAFGHFPFPVETSGFALFDLVTTVTTNDCEGLRFSLIEQLAILRALTGGKASLLNVHRVNAGYLANAAVSDQAAAVTLTGIVSPLGAGLTVSANTLTSPA